MSLQKLFRRVIDQDRSQFSDVFSVSTANLKRQTFHYSKLNKGRSQSSVSAGLSRKVDKGNNNFTSAGFHSLAALWFNTEV